jgi:hypothetical protein
MFASSKSGAVADPKDAQFNYVTMLLHGNGTNGAQNNTFVDSSTNNFTITRNGNTTQGTFTPYGSNWSNYFDGTGDYLSTPNSTSLQWGTGDFCVEAWIFPNSITGSKEIVCKGVNDAGTFDFGLYGSKIELYTTALVFSSTTSIVANTWTHVAVTRSGTTLRCFINGALDTTVTSSYNFNNTGTFYVGVYGSAAVNYFNGYLSNVRCVKGSAVYTSAFTPSTTPLTAITNTQLLTCQSNRFIDNSTNAFTLTKNGDTSVQRFSPFNATSAYSTSVIGGSGYFDGSGDYLDLASNAAFSFGTGDFTVEMWLYHTSNSAQRIIGNYVSSGNTEYDIEFAANGTVYFGSYLTYTQTSTAVSLNAWTHIAWVRASGVETFYINGVSAGSATRSLNFSSTTGPRIAGSKDLTTNLYNGYISDVRIVKGTAVYTTTFTPPTAQLTAITNTSLLLSYINAGILDNAMMNDLETVGNAQISTSVKKYGTGSMAFDGSGDWLTASSSSNYGYGSGDFTIEFWAYPTSGTGVQVFLDQRTGSSISAVPTIYTSSGTIYYYVSGSNRITGSSLSLNQWSHIAICRSGTSTKMFINGTQSGSTFTDTTTYLNAPVRIGDGNDGAGPYPFSGYIDDLRITKGFARYTANFTAPTAAFADKG